MEKETASEIKAESRIIPEIFKQMNQNGYDHLSLITAVDYPENDEIEIVYHLYSYQKKNTLTIKTRIDRKNPAVPTITGIYESADWHERETYDLSGVKFEGHDNLKRILLPETFEGHPLRKDYPLEKEQYADMDEEFQMDSSEILPAEDGEKFLHINMGPQHPSMHGVLRLRLLVDGEIIRRVYPVLGYLHRGMEKIAENLDYARFIPYTDRLDYVAGTLNNMPYVMAVENLMELKIPERAEYLRVTTMELGRIASHLVWLSAWGMDIGAITPIFYAFREREEILRIFEDLCGGRMNLNYFRIGGVSCDMNDSTEKRIMKFMKILPEKIDEYEQLLTDNEIVKARSAGIGYLSKEDAINFGVTGPVLRASGMRYDIRNEHPYSVYEDFNFRIPVENGCDAYSRYLIRIEEIRQSIEIIKQALENIPQGEIRTNIPKNLKLPEGEIYSRIESAKGEFGIYLISDGSEKPYRLRIRSPSFCNLSVLPKIAEGCKIADLIAIYGSLDIILGDSDR